jgi:hypothetical protein
VITLFAERPDSIHAIGPPLLGAPSFEAATDGETTQLFLPLRRRLYVAKAGAVRLPNSFEALNPKGLAQAIFWKEIPAGAGLRIEECVDCRDAEAILEWQANRGAGRGEILRAYFNEASGELSEIRVLGADRELRADVQYGDWAGVAGPSPGMKYPHTIRLHSVTNDYRVELKFSRITLNGNISPLWLRIRHAAGARQIVLSAKGSPGTRGQGLTDGPKD